jgi:hypothetical protein
VKQQKNKKEKQNDLLCPFLDPGDLVGAASSAIAAPPRKLPLKSANTNNQTKQKTKEKTKNYSFPFCFWLASDDGGAWLQYKVLAETIETEKWLQIPFPPSRAKKKENQNKNQSEEIHLRFALSMQHFSNGSTNAASSRSGIAGSFLFPLFCPFQRRLLQLHIANSNVD